GTPSSGEHQQACPLAHPRGSMLYQCVTDTPSSTPSSTFEGGGGIRSGCSWSLNAGTRRIGHDTWQLALQIPNCMETPPQVTPRAHVQAIQAHAPRSLLQSGKTLCH